MNTTMNTGLNFKMGKNKGLKSGKSLKKSLPFYVLLVPALFYFGLFKYAPIWGILISFKNYKPIYTFSTSNWVGIKNYVDFFTNEDFLRLLVNTLRIALNNILFYFPMPIIIALMLHELNNRVFKRLVQSMLYVPHFISWVVVVVITNYVFGDRGIINTTIEGLGLSSQPFLYSEKWFLPLILFQSIWKECGWGTIIFIAALTSVNLDLYEAATIDGAGRLQKLWHVTLPAIKSTIMVMFILRVGRFLDTGFEQIFLMLNGMNRNIGEVFDTFIYDQGILQGRFSYTMAISVFKSVVGFALVLITDRIAKFFGEEGII
jgi:putative aldouronate transport system permease protein